MMGAPSGFWGKLDRDAADEVSAWHPLADHCADVAACAEALLTRTILGPRLARLGGVESLSPTQVARLCALAALHDAGKLNIGFQNKALRNPTFKAGHVVDLVAMIFSNFPYPERDALRVALEVPTLESWADDSDQTGLRLWLAAIGHHGRPVTLEDAVDVQPRLWRPAGGLDPIQGARELVSSVRRWFPLAFAPGGDELPAGAGFQHAFAGLVMLADWLGSDDRDEMFPFSETADDRMPFSREQAMRTARWMGLEVRGSRVALGATRPGFERVSNCAPRPAQQAALALSPSARGSLTLLEAETGSGKTEAALAHFLRLFHSGHVDGLYFALPTRTSATQMQERVRAAIKRAFPDVDSRPPVVLAVPDYLRVDDATGKRLSRFEVLWNDDESSRMRFRGWAAENSKRFLVGTVVVGTIDQALLSALRVAHAHLRATALLRHLLVVDEVHASDAYMNAILDCVLAFHQAAGGHTLLMSATLGSTARTRHFGLPQPTLAEALDVPYPEVTHRDDGLAPSTIGVEPDSREKRVSVECARISGDAKSIATRALEAAAAGGRVLVLRNTVADAVATQRALEASSRDGREALLFRCAGQPAPHHARFARADREALDQSIEAALGISSPRSPGLVAVATQTVQQSLDLDADLLLTDLAPMDVLLQRIGRLHRHERPTRASSFERPRVIVLVPVDRDLGILLREKGDPRGPHGLGTIYDDLRILEATWLLLENRTEFVIPAMNRELVEHATHPDALKAIVDKRGGLWEKHAIGTLGKTLAAGRIADLNVLPRDVLIGDRGLGVPEALEGRIATRLGEGDRRILLDPATPGAFGTQINELRIPAWMARGIPAEPEVLVQSRADGLVVQVAALTFHYDRLGLRKADQYEDSGDE